MRSTRRNLDAEQPGTRYGSRVVLRADTIICGTIKYIGLWVRCDCGRTDLVRKSTLVSGVADRCRDCEGEAKILAARLRARKEA